MERSGEAMNKAQNAQLNAKTIEKMRAYRESMKQLEEELEEINKKNKKLRQDQKMFQAEYYMEQIETDKMQKEIEERKRLERNREKEYAMLVSQGFHEKLLHKHEEIVHERQVIHQLLTEVQKDLAEQKQKTQRFKAIEQVIEKEKNHLATPQEVIDKLQQEIQLRVAEIELQKQAMEILRKEREEKEKELCKPDEENVDKRKIKRELRDIINSENRMQEKIEDEEKELSPLTTLMQKLMARGTDAQLDPLSYEEIEVFKKLQEEKLQKLMQEKTELMLREVELQEEQKLCEQQLDPVYAEQMLENLAESKIERRSMEEILAKSGALKKEQKELYQKEKAAVDKYKDYHSIKGVADIIKERLFLFRQQEQENRRLAREQDVKDGPTFTRILDKLKNISNTGFLEKGSLVRSISDLKETADFYLKETHDENKGLAKEEREFRMEFALQISQFCEKTISELKDPLYDQQLGEKGLVKEIKAPVKELEVPHKELEEKQLDALMMNAPLAPMR